MPAVGDQHRAGPPSTMMSTMAGAVSANPFDEGPRRISEYTAQEIATLQSRLDKQLGPEYISSRAGPSGQKVHYLAAEKCINLANEVFGFNGWSSSIQSIQIDFVDESPNTGKISLGLSVIVRVTLRNGTYHEDVGYGHIENCKGKAAAFEKAKKEGTTDGLKRALRTFGNVLGNCIYDKEYLAKVTRVKVAPSKWDVDNLHRHPDYAPVKKEPVQERRISEDNALPPHPTEANARGANGSNGSSLTFDGDGEFGSDLFDETDFVANAAGNPDEISLDAELLQQPQRLYGQPQVPNFQQRAQGNLSRSAALPPEIVTPSKPEGPWIAGTTPAGKQILQNNATSTSQANMPDASRPAMMQRQPVPGPRQFQSAAAMQPSRPNKDTGPKDNGAAGLKVESSVVADNSSPTSINHMHTSGNEQKDNTPLNPTVGFFSARAVDILRDNPQAATTAAPRFDPHAESPSIRKTVGIDHTKSVPVSRPMLSGASPSTSSSRDFINPSTDIHRRIGAPGGSGLGSPASRGPSTSSYRPLTRPNIEPRNPGGNSAGMTRENHTAPQPNAGLKRPPLNDVTNATMAPTTAASVPGPGDPKRPRVSDGGQPMPPQQSS